MGTLLHKELEKDLIPSSLNGLYLPFFADLALKAMVIKMSC